MNESASMILDALYAVGLHNWEGYDMTMESLGTDSPSDDKLLEALQANGVDSWEGYSEAQELWMGL